MTIFARLISVLLLGAALTAYAADSHDDHGHDEPDHAADPAPSKPAGAGTAPGDDGNVADAHGDNGHGADEHGDDEHGDDDHGDGEHGAGEHDDEGRVRLTPQQLAAFGVTLATAGPGRVDHGIELLGEVRPNGETLVHVVPRFPGIVREVRKSIGDTVRSGDVLAVIESSESLAPYQIKTQLNGTIIDRDMAVGEAVDRDKQSFTIADLSTVWVDLAVYQRDLDHVRVGQDVVIRTGAGHAIADGRISYVAPIVNEPTRTATARVVLPNPDRSWRPGLFVTGRILDPAEAPVVVQRSAIQTIAGRPTVFIERDGAFDPRPVTLGRLGDTAVEVLSGVAPGDRYVATNSFLLKAELGKGEAEHAH